MHGSVIFYIPLAYSQLGGLEDYALQRAMFCCCFLPASLAKSSNKKIALWRAQPSKPPNRE